MKLWKTASIAFATVSLASAPVIAQTAAAPVSQVRASAELQDENRLGGSLIVGVLAAAAIIAGIVIAVDGDDDPQSP